MTDEAALLAAIRACPDDDTPRLVYADWCDDNDRPERAAFIRCQIEIARPVAGCKETPSCLASNRPREIGRWCPACWPKRGLLRTEDDLYAAVGCDGLPVGIGSPQVTWVRGFVEACEVSAEAWLRHGDAIRAAHPVRRVTFTTDPYLLWTDLEGPAVREMLADEWPGIAFDWTPADLDWWDVAAAVTGAPPYRVVRDAANAVRRFVSGVPVYTTGGDRVRTAAGLEGTLVGEVDELGRATVRLDGPSSAPPSPPG